MVSSRQKSLKTSAKIQTTAKLGKQSIDVT